jgi:hypothetical protein
MRSGTDKNKEKDFDTVKTFRAIKEKISNDIADMNLDQIKEYLKPKQVHKQKKASN